MSPFNWHIGISGKSISIRGSGIKKAEQLSSALEIVSINRQSYY